MPDLDLFASDSVNASEHNTFPASVNEAVTVVEAFSGEMPIGVSVFDTSAVTESTTCAGDTCSMSAFDPVLMQEIFAIGLDPLGLTVFDPVAIQENTALGLDPTPLSVFDPISVQDYGDIYNFINVAEEILADTVNVSVEIQPSIVVFDLIAVVEFADRNTANDVDRADSITVSEFFNFNFQFLFINVSDTATLVEQAFQPDVAFFFEVFDAVFLDAITGANLTIGQVIFRFDNIAIAENITIARDILFVDRFDAITITQARVLGRDPELLSAIENIAVNEVVFLQTASDLTFNDFLRSYPFVEETITSVLAERFENGAEQRRDRWGRTRKRFQVNFSPRSKIEIEAVRSFYESKRGPANAFNFINPLDNVDYVVRFEDNSFQIRREAFGVYSASVVVVEVFI